MNLLHTNATRQQGHLWRPQRQPIILEPCISGTAQVWRNGMVHVLTLWSIIGDATMYMDKSAHSLKLGLPPVQGCGNICCVWAMCAGTEHHATLGAI